MLNMRSKTKYRVIMIIIKIKNKNNKDFTNKGCISDNTVNLPYGPQTDRTKLQIQVKNKQYKTIGLHF